MDNHNLWQNIRTWDAQKLQSYYQQQEYIKTRGEQLNAGV
jgi:hypothetical protein